MNTMRGRVIDTGWVHLPRASYARFGRESSSQSLRLRNIALGRGRSVRRGRPAVFYSEDGILYVIIIIIIIIITIIVFITTRSFRVRGKKKKNAYNETASSSRRRRAAIIWTI